MNGPASLAPHPLSASLVRENYPAIVGTVTGGEIYSDGFCIVFQGRGAFAVMDGLTYRACASTHAKARAMVKRLRLERGGAQS